MSSLPRSADIYGSIRQESNFLVLNNLLARAAKRGHGHLRGGGRSDCPPTASGRDPLHGVVNFNSQEFGERASDGRSRSTVAIRGGRGPRSAEELS